MNEKRYTLKKIGAVGIATTMLPNKWTKPIINSVLLPAHAQTSGALKLDVANDVIFTPANSADAHATGSIYWAEFFIARITGVGIQSRAVYSLVDLPEILTWPPSSFSPGVSSIDMRITSGPRSSSGVERARGEIYFYTDEGIFSDINGVYNLTVQVENSDGQKATTTLKLTFEGF